MDVKSIDVLVFAVQLMLNGLEDIGLIHLGGH
jgi:hypothetical protein